MPKHRYIQVTHTYMLEVPDGTEVVDIQNGISIMEGFMKRRSARMAELRSSWAWAPREYTPPPDDPRAEAVAMTVPSMHPWDQGSWIFPVDHPLRDTEGLYREQYLNPQYKGHLKPELKQKMKELESGE